MFDVNIQECVTESLSQDGNILADARQDLLLTGKSCEADVMKFPHLIKVTCTNSSNQHTVKSDIFERLPNVSWFV